MDSFKKDERERFRFVKKHRRGSIDRDKKKHGHGSIDRDKLKEYIILTFLFILLPIALMIGGIAGVASMSIDSSFGLAIPFFAMIFIGLIVSMSGISVIISELKEYFNKRREHILEDEIQTKALIIKRAVKNVTEQYDIAKEHNDCESKFYDLLLEYAPQAEVIRKKVLSTRNRDLRQERKDGIRKDPYENYLLGIIQMSKVKNALYYFKAASDDGWIPATYEAGKCYFYGGMGVRRNFKKAAKYFKKCVEEESYCYQSVTYAKLYLADQYFWGLGVAKDINKANKLYQEIVDHKEKGHEYALLRLERTEVPCPKCGGDGALAANGQYECSICKHTFELTEDMRAKVPVVTHLTAAEIEERCGKSIMSIYTVNKRECAAGSAFLIANEGYALTNAHVVVNKKGKVHSHIYARFMDELIDLKVVKWKYGKGDDMALIKLDRVPCGARELHLADSDLISVWDAVYAMGNTIDDEHFSNGMIRNVRASYNGRDNAILTNCAGINSDSMGGPMINADGDAIGMLAWSAIISDDEIKTSEPQNRDPELQYSIPSNDLNKFLNDSDIRSFSCTDI